MKRALFGVLLMTTLGQLDVFAQGPWAGNPGAEEFSASVRSELEQAKEARARLLRETGPRTVENTLRVYDDVRLHIEAADAVSELMAAVHPDAAIREAAEKLAQEVSAFATDLSLDPAVYGALQSIDAKSADDVTRHYLEKTLRSFRLAGVDRDEATRARVKKLQDELVLISQEFGRNIREDATTVQTTVAELAGLPADFIARHKPDAAGVVTLTVQYPDYFPVMTYAKSDDLRRRMYIAYQNKAYPRNIAVLDRLIAKRAELAQVLGFASWADYVTADKMVGTAQNASDFIARVVAASAQPARNDYAELLARKRQDVPGATGLDKWETTYWSNLVRQQRYAYDAQKVRPYFAYDRVRDGVLDVMSRMLNVKFVAQKDAPVWHPSVETYDVELDGRKIGRIYLDMHPRANKYSHAANFTIRSGVAGRQLPESALVCNFPGGEQGDPGLMEYNDVVTFFHEFGHLMHVILSGRQPYLGVSGTRTEWDFVEAPSQMLEEWARDPQVLSRFARHVETGEPIPAELVSSLIRAQEFGKGLNVRQQMVYARLSLSVYDRPPAQVDTDSMITALDNEYLPMPHVPETHWQAAFNHLDGYSAIYYTYMWSLVISKDLYSAFKSQDLLGSPVATRYRDTILAPGGSAPAATLVERFLGRPFGFDAWERWLNRPAA